MNFFLIDDDPDDRDFFEIAVNELPVEVKLHVAQSGSEALSILYHVVELPDLIFLDLNMPKMDGKECLRELKSNPRTAEIPVIVFSTSSEQRDIEETSALGAIAFISKPSKVFELTKKLSAFLNKHYPKTIHNEK